MEIGEQQGTESQLHSAAKNISSAAGLVILVTEKSGFDLASVRIHASKWHVPKPAVPTQECDISQNSHPVTVGLFEDMNSDRMSRVPRIHLANDLDAVSPLQVAPEHRSRGRFRQFDPVQEHRHTADRWVGACVEYDKIPVSIFIKVPANRSGRIPARWMVTGKGEGKDLAKTPAE